MATAVQADEEIAKFATFYLNRLAEEYERAGNDARRQHKLESDFKPVVFAEIAAMEGYRYQTGRLVVSFTLDGCHEYSVQLTAIPATGQILNEPARETCDLTHVAVPAACLETCVFSKRRILRHRLVRSEVSQRWALPSYAVKCQVTGKTLLQDEIGKSDLSGKQVLPSLLKSSPVSGRRALVDEFGRCEITDTDVLPDELIASEVSGRKFRADQREISASGKVGHRSEFVYCKFAHQFLLPEETVGSDVSGRRVRSDLALHSEKPPGRLGAPDEVVVCSASGRRLLSDEVAASAVSGKLVDRELLVASGRSGSLGLADEMVTCSETGKHLLPVESGRCVISGQVYDSQLLSHSEASGQTALSKVFTRCQKTGKLVLPQELAECDLTKMRVLPSELEICAVSGRKVLRERMLQSEISGAYVLPEYAVRSLVSRKVGLPNEVIHCTWLNGPVLKDESGICRRTGLTFSKQFLNEDGEFAVLRQLLNGGNGASSGRDLVPWLKETKPELFANLKQVDCTPSPDGSRRAVAGETRTFFGLSARHIGLIVKEDGQRTMLGRCTIGRRTRSGWVLERDVG